MSKTLALRGSPESPLSYWKIGKRPMQCLHAAVTGQNVLICFGFIPSMVMESESEPVCKKPSPCYLWSVDTDGDVTVCPVSRTE